MHYSGPEGAVEPSDGARPARHARSRPPGLERKTVLKQSAREFFAAIPTPFDADGRLRLDLFEGIVEHNISQGLQGLYVGGTTGEWPAMTVAERLDVFRTVAEVTRRRVKLYAHVGALATGEACTLAAAAASLGYDAVSAVPPFYNDYSADEIAAYYGRIGGASDLPMVLYYIPSRTGGKFDVAFLERLSQSEKVSGIKFTDMNLFLMEQVASRIQDKYLYYGCDEMLLGGLALGANGGIGSTYNFAGWRILRLAAALDAGDLATARHHQRIVNGYLEVMFKAGLLSSLKYILNRLGVESGQCRRPVATPSPEMCAALDRVIEADLGDRQSVAPFRSAHHDQVLVD
jgi:N-acetylneuraminate lyase